MTLAAAASDTLSFSITVPGVVEPSVYLGNSIRSAPSAFDVGTYFDRSCFAFSVT